MQCSYVNLAERQLQSTSVVNMTYVPKKLFMDINLHKNFILKAMLSAYFIIKHFKSLSEIYTLSLVICLCESIKHHFHHLMYNHKVTYKFGKIFKYIRDKISLFEA